MATLPALRKQKGYRQQDIADYLGMSQSTYAYKEGAGTFDDIERQKIAKYLKVDMTTISWTKPIFQAKQTDEKDKTMEERLPVIKSHH